jgi:esterase/lipase
MEEFIANVLKDGGYAAILVVVLLYFFKFLKAEVIEVRQSLDDYTKVVGELVQKTTDIMQQYNELSKHYYETVASVKKIEAALMVAFSGSDVESYQSAAKVLKMNKEE